MRLSRGDYDTSKLYSDSPADMARRFADAGVRRIHLVDLDGAKAGKPCNLKVLSEIRKAVSVELEWGGGLKKEDHLDMSFECGADCVVCGSVAVKEPLKLVKWLREFGGEKVILGADLRDGKAATAGWTEDSSVTADSLVERFMKNGLAAIRRKDPDCYRHFQGWHAPGTVRPAVRAVAGEISVRHFHSQRRHQFHG